MLAPALEGFSPTLEMPEIAEAQALLDRARSDRRGQGRGSAAAAADAIARRPRRRALRGSRRWRAGNDRSLRQSPRVDVRRRERARTVGGRCTAYGSAAMCGASCRRCGRTQRPSSATSRRDPIRPRPASPIAPPGSLAGSPASIARRGIIWNARSPCSGPAATTIWPFASEMDPGVAAMVYLAAAFVASRRGRSRDFAH